MLTAEITPATEECPSELLIALTTEQLQQLTICLSPAELLAGCQVYQVPNDEFAPRLPEGSYVVVQPLEWSQLIAIQPGDYCLVTAEYMGSDAPGMHAENILAHHFLRTTRNGLRAGKPLVGVVADPASEPLPEPFWLEEHAQASLFRYLRKVARVTKVITLLA